MRLVAAGNTVRVLTDYYTSFQDTELRRTVVKMLYPNIARQADKVIIGKTVPSAIKMRDLSAAYSYMSRAQAVAAAEQDPRDGARYVLGRVWPGAENRLAWRRQKPVGRSGNSVWELPRDSSLRERLEYVEKKKRDNTLNRRDILWLQNFFTEEFVLEQVSPEDVEMLGGVLLDYCWGALNNTASPTVIEAVLRSGAWAQLTKHNRREVNETVVHALMGSEITVAEVAQFFSTVVGRAVSVNPPTLACSGLSLVAIKYFLTGKTEGRIGDVREQTMQDALDLLDIIDTPEIRESFLNGNLAYAHTRDELSAAKQKLPNESRVLGLLVDSALEKWLKYCGEEELLLWAQAATPSRVLDVVATLPEARQQCVLRAMFQRTTKLLSGWAPRRGHFYQEAAAKRLYDEFGENSSVWGLYCTLGKNFPGTVDDLFATLHASQQA